jgi:hypothetical protein
MSFRCFAQSDETVADQWSKETGTSETWTLAGAIGTGESGSFHISSGDGRRGACKPAFAADTTPRAGHEKIAADLAFHLKLSVPASCLWTNPEGGSQFSISVWAFAQAMTWGEASPKLSATFMQNAAPFFAAARVFHTWIGDTDHNGNAGNVLVDMNSTDVTPGVAFIDHAFSMSQIPNFAEGAVQPLGVHYLPQNLSNIEATVKMINYINDLEATMIEDIVRRVPTAFLPSERAEVIIKGLLKRRLELSKAFGVGLA